MAWTGKCEGQKSDSSFTTHDPQPTDGGNASVQRNIIITPKTTHNPQVPLVGDLFIYFLITPLKMKVF